MQRTVRKKHGGVFSAGMLAAGIFAVMSSLVIGSDALGQSFCRYEVTALVPGPSCGIFGPANVLVHGLNDLGQVVGEVRECAGGSRRFPFVWSEATGLVVLPFPEDVISGWATAINNVTGRDGLGQIACRLTVQLPENDFAERAFLYDDGEWTALGTLPGDRVSRPFAINDKTEIVGESRGGGNPIRAFVWREGVMSAVELPLGPNSEAHDISQHSSIVGWMGEAISTFSRAFLHAIDLAEEIPPLDGSESMQSRAVNSLDAVVGHGVVEEKSIASIQPWIWQDGVLEALPHPEEFDRTRGRGINDAGQVIIETGSSDPFVFTYGIIWQNGEWIDVPSLFDAPPGTSFRGNRAVMNNLGQIAGDEGLGFILLSPTDRPLGDVNIDCVVDGHDLAAVLRDWGPCPEVGSCLCDIVTSATLQPPGDGKVDGADLAVVLGNWSPARSDSGSQTRR